MIGAGGALLALLFLLSRGRGGSDTSAAPAPDPATMPMFAPPVDTGGGADLSELYSTVGQLQAGQQQLADMVIGGQQQLIDRIGAIQLGGAAAPVEPPPPIDASPVVRAGAHNAPDPTSAKRAPSQKPTPMPRPAPTQIHLRVADARDVGRVPRGTTNRQIADLARQHPDWGPHTLAAGHPIRGHSTRF